MTGSLTSLFTRLTPSVCCPPRGVSSLRKRRTPAALLCAGIALIVGIFAWTAMLHMTDPRLPPAFIEGQRFWELQTGSRTAYVRVLTEGRTQEAPILFLHGGKDRTSEIHYAIDQVEQS
jgi:hypothetical protein